MMQHRLSFARSMSAIGLLAAALAVRPAAGALRVVPLRGEGANNNAVSGGGTSPAVQVTDGNGSPVRDALVVFSAPESGVSVDFGGAGPSAHSLTDETGAAVAPRVKPVGGNGPVEIRVSASKAGEFANAAIHQMNLGVGDGGRSQELNVTAVPSASTKTDFGVRAEDGDGRAVPWANVVIVLRKWTESGKTEEIERQQGPTREDGTFVGHFTKMNTAGHLEIVYRAEFDGRRATRYFRLK